MALTRVSMGVSRGWSETEENPNVALFFFFFFFFSFSINFSHRKSRLGAFARSGTGALFELSKVQRSEENGNGSGSGSENNSPALVPRPAPTAAQLAPRLSTKNQKDVAGSPSKEKKKRKKMKLKDISRVVGIEHLAVWCSVARQLSALAWRLFYSLNQTLSVALDDDKQLSQKRRLVQFFENLRLLRFCFFVLFLAFFSEPQQCLIKLSHLL
jgi:hypothetical protein